MADDWISGLLRCFFWYALILGQRSEGQVGGLEGRGERWEEVQIFKLAVYSRKSHQE